MYLNLISNNQLVFILHMKKILEHLPTSILCSILFFQSSQNIVLSIIPLVAGWLIDLDHLLDYFIYLKRSGKRFNLNFFLSGKYFEENKKVIVIFHSWEIAIFLYVLYYFIEDYLLKNLFFFTFLSYLIHIIIDQLTNKPVILGYSTIYRLNKKFDINSFCKPN